MNTKNCYVINNDFVVHEQIDNELTVINLQKGHYFIGKGPAIDIFLMLKNENTIDTLVDKTRAIYAVEEAVVREATSSFITLWLSNDLIRKVESCPETLEERPAKDSTLKPWIQPIFIAFDDMRDLLLLDPIHETNLDEQGWPIAANDDGSK